MKTAKQYKGTFGSLQFKASDAWSQLKSDRATACALTKSPNDIPIHEVQVLRTLW